MNNEVLPLIIKRTDTLFEQTKTKPQETLELKMDKQMQTFSFNPKINLVEEGKWLLGVTSLECTISVSNVTDENNSFSVIIPSRWRILKYLPEGIIDKLGDLLKLRSENDIELHVEEVKNVEMRYQEEKKFIDYLTLMFIKKERLEGLKSIKYHDLEDLCYRMELTYDEIMDILDIK